MAVKMMLVHSLTSLHAGSGQGVGAIDMPIGQREGDRLALRARLDAEGVP